MDMYSRFYGTLIVEVKARGGASACLFTCLLCVPGLVTCLLPVAFSQTFIPVRCPPTCLFACRLCWFQDAQDFELRTQTLLLPAMEHAGGEVLLQFLQHLPALVSKVKQGSHFALA